MIKLISFCDRVLLLWQFFRSAAVVPNCLIRILRLAANFTIAALFPEFYINIDVISNLPGKVLILPNNENIDRRETVHVERRRRTYSCHATLVACIA